MKFVRFIGIINILFVLIVPPDLWAQARDFSATIEGGRGLLFMQSARTYGKGAFIIGLKGIVMKRETPVLMPSGDSVNKVDYPAILGLPVTVGMTDEVDLTASFYGFNDARVPIDKYDINRGYSEPGGGIGVSRFGVKVRMPFSMDSRIQIAGKFGAFFDTSARQIDGMNYWWSRTGTDIETSIYETFDITSFLSLNLEQGYITSGSDIYDDQIVGAAGLQLRLHDIMALNLEVANRTFRGISPQSVLKAGSNPDMYYSVDGVPGIGNPGLVRDLKEDYREDFFIFSPSLVFRLNNTIYFDIGANINIADQVDPKETFQCVIGITFRGEFKSMIDSDGDGINNKNDLERTTPRGYPVNGRGIALDTDADGVLDGADREQETPFGARVNSFGIGIDSDEDGVYDGIDMEPTTPKGCPVDQFGVAYDDDRDGVPNGIDFEPDTLLGAVVNENGVSLDDDGDGVPNGLDYESETPKGAEVDENGVAVDSDGDGIPDGIDIEPNTPRGILVDKSGRALIRQEYSLLREGLIRLNTINFKIGSSEIDPESYTVLDEIGQLLRKYPLLMIQIGGHTDSTGAKETNFRISRERAISVREYILKRFPEITKERLLAVGFGSDKPIASNATYEGRKMNRRVEFIVINQEELLDINRNP